MHKPIASHAAHHPVVQLALLVDRDADTRWMYAEYLRFGAWLVDEAADGRDALAKAIARHPDVIVTESRLPGISGFDLCSMLKRDPSTRAIPIVMVTADAFVADRQRAQSSGADVVLVKPCLPETLASEMQRLVAKSQHPSRGKQRITTSRAHPRGHTTTPPLPPPTLTCPECEKPLVYRRSHLGAAVASHAEQWDYFECLHGCGTFQYRERTRTLRRVR